MSSKRCFKCGETKPLEAFYAHAQMADGHLNKCKECTKADAISNRSKRRDYYLSYDRSRSSLDHRLKLIEDYRKTDAGREVRKKACAKWAASNPSRRSANIAVGNALRSGQLVRYPCLVCGSDHVEAHHPAYDMPLVVTWLCSKHHKQLHKEMRRAGNS